MQKLCRNYVIIMQIMQIMQKLCKNYANKIMQKLCKNYAKIMQKLCNVPGMHYYACIMQKLCKLRKNYANYASLRKYANYAYPTLLMSVCPSLAVRRIVTARHQSGQDGSAQQVRCRTGPTAAAAANFNTTRARATQPA